ncbi:MAG: N-glycosylase/DNA lyase [Nanoarchaeota archaeon]
MKKQELIKEIIKLIKKFTINDIKEIEERLDKQFLALKKLNENFDDKELLIKLVIINALLSYYLSMKGEQYWQKFSEFFSKKENQSIDKFEEFLKKYNYRLLKQKLSRLEKVKKTIEKLNLQKIDYFANNLEEFIEYLASNLNQNKNSKTIVFATKMFNYIYRIISNDFIPMPRNAMIPLDVRIKKISNSTKFWKELREKLPYSLLHLDSLLWITMGLKEDEIKKSSINKELKEGLLRLKCLLDKLVNDK